MFHSSWQDRLKQIIGPIGFQPYMRRSMQTIVLYEAKRCIAPRIPRLRPFQKRALLLNMVYNILREIDFLGPSEKAAVLWKTQRSQEQLDPVTAWKRCKIIERDLNKLLRDFPPFVAPGRPQSISVDMFVQDMYNTLNGIDSDHAREAKLVPPPQWEYLHNHAVLTLRLYYHGTALDPRFPDPIISPFEIAVPSERPPADEVPEYQTFEEGKCNPAAGAIAIDPNALLLVAAAATGTPAASLANPALLAQLAALPQGIDAQAVVAAASLVPAALMQPAAASASAFAAAAVARVPSPSVGDSSVSNSNHSSSLAAGDRLQSLLQAREQMELLNRLQGVLPNEELARRKRALYNVPGPEPKQQGKEEEDEQGAAEEPPRKKASR